MGSPSGRTVTRGTGRGRPARVVPVASPTPRDVWDRLVAADGRDGQPLALARRRATRREPDRKLRTVSAALGASCRLYVAAVGGRPAAGVVVLLGAACATYWRGAMDEEVAGKTYANDLLHRTAIEDACAAGWWAYHMGDSAPESPLALFKSRFGAEECHYASYRLERLPLTSAIDAAHDAVGEALRRRRGRS